MKWRYQRDGKEKEGKKKEVTAYSAPSD